MDLPLRVSLYKYMYCCLLFTVVERPVALADILRVHKHVCVMSLMMDDVAGL